MLLIPHMFSVFAPHRFSVFALGSKAYPNYCAFGRYLDRLLEELGGKRLHPRGEGDELRNQDDSFAEWAKVTFKVIKYFLTLSIEINLMIDYMKELEIDA